ncbi:hypothetical protein, partial [Enterobacter hormaechei]|uniref:hypothetical protein n=1 Tax=Enterobacter hormaechei TaxID=158836 RepID=UPI0023E3C88C
SIPIEFVMKIDAQVFVLFHNLKWAIFKQKLVLYAPILLQREDRSECSPLIKTEKETEVS